jgi:hypothetical protein
MAKILIQDGHYAFDSGAKTITFSDYATIDINGVLLITNVTHGVIIYQFDKPTLLGTVTTNVLTLTYDSSWMSDTDDLQIWYWDSTIGDSATVENFPSTYPLPGSQITTLTPPAAITGYATETTLSTLNAKVPASPATSTKQGDGSQKTQVVDGSGNVIGSTGNAVDINIKSGNPTSITANAGANLNTSLLALETGGNLAALNTATGAKADAEATTNTGTFSIIALLKRLLNTVLSKGQTTKSGSLPVAIASDQDTLNVATGLTQPLTDIQLRATAVPVSGTVTANAGTNLNTSALATEAGNLATIKTNTDKLDVALSTRLKPTDTLTKVTTVDTITNVVTVNGTVTANTGLTQPLTDVQLRASSVPVDTELITKDYDSGAGTDTVAAVGILLPKSGGSVAGGTATDPLRTDPTGTTTQPISGTVTANAGTNLNTSNLDVALSTRLKPTDTLTKVTTVDTITNVVHVDDNSDSLTIDGSVSITGTPTVDTELTTKDYDTGAGTDTVASVGILLPKSGGSVAGGTSTDPIRTDPTGTTTQPVSGTVSVNALPAGTNNIGDVDVLTLPALPAGTNAIGKLAANDGVDIGDVTINNTSLAVTGTFWQATQPVSVASIPSHAVTNAGTFAVQDSEKVADNAGFTDGTTKVQPVAYIYDEVAGTALTENDIAAARIDSKRSVVNVIEDESTRGRRLTITAANAAKVDGSAVTQPVSGTFWQATQPVSVAAAVHVDDNSGSLTVDAPVGTPVYTRLSDGSATLIAQKTKANSLPVVLASDQLVLEVTGSVSNPTGGAALIASQDVGQYKFISIHFQFSGATMNIDLFASNDNSNWKNLYLTKSDVNPTSTQTTSNSPSTSGIYTGALTGRYFKAEVSVSSAGSCTATAEFSAIPPNSPVTYSAQSGTWNTVETGNVAHDAVDSGSPVKVGAKAITSLKTTTLVSNADRTDAQSDLDGAIIVRQQFPLGDLISERVTDTGGTSTAFSNFTAVASTSNYITAISVHNSSATNGTVDFRNGTGGSVLWTMRIPANNGSEMTCGGVPLFKTSANTALAYDVSGALSTVSISVSGFQSKV